MKFIRDYNQISDESSERRFVDFFIDNKVLDDMGIVDGGISTLGIGANIGRQSCRDWHILIFCFGGTGLFSMEDGTEFSLEQGQCFFSSADGQGHVHHPLTAEWKLCWLHIRKDVDWLINPPEDYAITKSRYGNEIMQCLDSILSEFSEKRLDYSGIVDLQAQLLARYTKREIDIIDYTGKNAGYLRKFSELWNVVSMSIDRNWDMPMIADFMDLSKSQTIRLCRKYYGMTPAEKVKRLKMEYAYSILKHLDYTVAEVAEKVGFNSISSFSYSFKEFFHELPKDVQKSKFRYYESDAGVSKSCQP